MVQLTVLCMCPLRTACSLILASRNFVRAPTPLHTPTIAAYPSPSPFTSVPSTHAPFFHQEDKNKLEKEMKAKVGCGVHVHMCVCVCACVCVCMCVCMCACACVCMCACMHACTFLVLYACLQTNQLASLEQQMKVAVDKSEQVCT